MAKFFKYILLLIIIIIIIIFVFVVTPLDLIYAQEIFRAPIVGKFTITDGPGEGMHKGVSEYAIDISTSGEKVDVYAVGDGVVEIAGTMIKNEEDKVMTVPYGSNLEGLEIVGFGNYIIIAHKDNYKSLYAHLSDINVKKDEAVSKGKKIAKSGNTGLSIGQTGMHLHFEIRKDNKSVDLIGLLENFNRDNFTQEYWNWREGKTEVPPSKSSGNITGSPLETPTSNQTTAHESKSEKNVSFLGNIVNFFKKIGEFFASVFSYKSPSYVRAAEKEGKIVEDSYQLYEMPEQSFSLETETITEETSSETSITEPADIKNLHKIAFSSDRDGNYEIYTMNADGSDQRRITDHHADDWYPTWSPDGKLIAFVSNRDGNAEIYTMNADGSDQKRITENISDDRDPAWSPDGKLIAFVSDFSDIFVMKKDGSGVVNLTNNGAINRYPNWSPDGSKIVFTSDLNGDWGIYIMNQDGSNLINIINNDEINMYVACPDWSPDGNKIAFNSDQNGDYDIYIMNKNGSNVINLTNIENPPFTNWAPDGGPDWSPDGGKIVFESNRDGDWNIYIMNKDGSEVINLTSNNANDGYPAFSPKFSPIPETIAKSATEKASYSIGDIGPAGGLIFYINPNYEADGWKYLEAAPVDQSSGIHWNNGINVETGATATEVGAGKINTQTIVNIQGEGIYAAQLCNELIQGGYSDWFLPSKDELDLMYKNLKKAGLGDFSYFYWSSSECIWPSPEGIAEYAWMQYFHDGSHGMADKDLNDIRVRAARAF